MTVHDRMSVVRSLVNRREMVDHLMVDRAKWNRLCAAMDIVGDTQSAIDAHPSAANHEDVGLMYLVHYGLLQTLLVQQDAMKAMCEAFGMKDPKFNRREPTKRIRIMRDRAVGHAVSKQNRVWGIIQISMTPDGFDVYGFDETDGDWDRFDTQEACHDQEGAIVACLDQVIDCIQDLSDQVPSA